jgi:two-component system LytT family response regulator
MNKEKIQTMIVDDEIAFIKTMHILLESHPDFKIIGVARGVEEAVEKINKIEPDVVFLDVEMEDGTGFDVLRRVDRKDFKVIFVTAFDHYAVEAFRFSAIDYLLKPVISEDLMIALEKVKGALENEKANYQFKVLLENIHSLSKERKKIVLKEMDVHHIVQLDNIIWCTADGSYTKFYLCGGDSILVSKHLKEFEDLLSPNGFFRVHRSHLVNLNKIKRFERSEGGILYMEEDHIVPVSVRKKDRLGAMLSHL